MVMLANAQGLRAEIAQRGAALAGMWVPDRDGQLADVVLGHAPQCQRTSGRAFLGASIGRVAGRISTAGFMLGGHHHRLDSVDGLTTHHGGPDGFDARDWQWLGVRRDRARLQLVSPHGDQGFPGALTVTVDYRLDDTHFTEYTEPQFFQELQAAGLEARRFSVAFGEIWAVIEPLPQSAPV